MLLNYQLTFNDFRDALGHHTARQIRQRRAKRLKVLRIIFIADIALLVMIVSYSSLGVAMSGRYTVSQLLQYYLSPYALAGVRSLPWIGVFSTVVGAGFAQRKPRTTFWIMLWILLILLGLGGLSGWIALSSPLPKGSLSAMELSHIRTTDLFAWLYMTILWALLTWAVVRRPGQLWKIQSNLHRPKTLQIDADGVVVFDDVSRHIYQWPAIAKLVDSPTAILIYPNEAAYHILPKRAFANQGDVDEFWRLAKEKGESPAQGFRVVPVGQV